MPTIYACDSCGKVVDNYKDLRSIDIEFDSNESMRQDHYQTESFEACYNCRHSVANSMRYNKKSAFDIKVIKS